VKTRNNASGLLPESGLVIKYVFDSSSVIALLRQENGAKIVKDAIPFSVISAVNYAETLAKAQDKGFPVSELSELLDEWGLEIIPFSREVAVRSAQLKQQMVGKPKADNVSVADRACLATAAHYGLTALTADRPWKDLELNIPIEFIR